jgi:hypothetical protein
MVSAFASVFSGTVSVNPVPVPLVYDSVSYGVFSEGADKGTGSSSSDDF